LASLGTGPGQGGDVRWSHHGHQAGQLQYR
jgi:hypothetical protein